jgi:hypothetical protein
MLELAYKFMCCVGMPVVCPECHLLRKRIIINLFGFPLDRLHPLWYNHTMKQYSREIKVKGGTLRIVKISRTHWQWTVFLANNVFHANTMEQSSPRCYEIHSRSPNSNIGSVIIEETQFRVVQRFMALRYGIEI